MPETQLHTGRLRKFIPQPDRHAARYGNFTLTRRDVETLDVIYRYRFLEARHIRALIDGSDQQITRRLQGLFHHSYVGRYTRRERMRLDLEPGAPLIAYGLETKGARALEQLRRPCGAEGTDSPRQIRWKKAYTRRTEWFVEHQLMVSNFRCAVELALCKAPDTELVSWQQGPDTWLRVMVPGEPRRSVSVAPDAYFVVRQGEHLRHFFLEADRSTEEHKRILRKYDNYWWYLQHARFDGPQRARPRVNVLFLTTGMSRMLNIMETLKDMPKPTRAVHGGKGAFRFCVEQDISIEDPYWISKPTWRTVANSVDARRQPPTTPLL